MSMPRNAASAFFFVIAILVFFGVMGWFISALPKIVDDTEPSTTVADVAEEEPVAVNDEPIFVPIGTEGEYLLTNPTSGSRWYVRVLRPDVLPAQAIVMVPGGVGDSSNFLTNKRDAQDLVDQGFVVVLFDPEGRGRSEGEENQNGTIGQDGLFALVTAVEGLDDVTEVGVITLSYGITMGSGMLARYPDAPVEFLIDWEGPADRTDTGGCDADDTGHLKDAATCDDEAFWAEREALTFIDDIRVPYLRLQTKSDHAQPDYSHTMTMVNAAVAAGSPWVRLNNETPNVTYTDVAMPMMLPESFDFEMMTRFGAYATELFAM